MATGMDATIHDLERKPSVRRGKPGRTDEPGKVQTDLFAKQSAESNAELIEKLKPLILELARRAHPVSILWADVRIVAVQRGILTGHEKGKDLSFGGAAMGAAGLAPTGQYRRSHVPESHGNLHAEWRLP